MKLATGIIPARYHSSRFDGKPLALIARKPMIQRVYERARTAKHLDRIIIATDDERIFDAAKDFGAEAQMTSVDHNSGTERVAEVAKKIDAPIIVNIQGDEPFIAGEMIDDLIESLQDKAIPMATIVTKIKDSSLIQEENIVKVIVNREGFALYFSRSILRPRIFNRLFQHVGIYGYQRSFLLKYETLLPSKNEKIEKLEQLRVLENGYKIKAVETEIATMSVDISQDITLAEAFLEREKAAA